MILAQHLTHVAQNVKPTYDLWDEEVERQNVLSAHLRLTRVLHQIFIQYGAHMQVNWLLVYGITVSYGRKAL
jgi:hypothetical protein